jgi:hypothetical protein
MSMKKTSLFLVPANAHFRAKIQPLDAKMSRKIVPSWWEEADFRFGIEPKVWISRKIQLGRQPRFPWMVQAKILETERIGFYVLRRRTIHSDGIDCGKLRNAAESPGPESTESTEVKK